MISLRLAVIGDPIAHSQSPRLHRAFLAEADVAGSYEAVRVAAGDTARAVRTLRAAGYAGLNVTTPLKEEAFACAESRDAASELSGSVNTLLLGERIEGRNTDGMGAIGALRAAGLPELAGKHVLVLGAGPTARAALAALLAADCCAHVWNRTRAKADALATQLGARAYAAGVAYDAILCALPPGVRFTDTALVASLQDASLVIDANYGARSTLGASLGRCVIDGGAMLEASARASFAMFRAAAAR